jgi:Ca-activated chloride channel family protein
MLLEVKDMEMKQILLITDGRSNVGGDPARAAAYAAQNGITVNAVGIIDGDNDVLSSDEIKAIALAGNGTWQMVPLGMLSATMCTVTYRSMHNTLENIVNAQVKKIVGSDMLDIEPAMRLPLVRYADTLADETPLRCVILVDCSNSMAVKLKTARAAILDLLASFKVRRAGGNLAVIAFPGQSGSHYQMICPFTDDMELLKGHLNELKHRGNTPTAHAINAAISYILNDEQPFFV